MKKKKKLIDFFTILKREKRFRFKETSIVGQESVGSEFERIAPVSRIRVHGPLHWNDHSAAWHIVTAYLHILDEQIFPSRKVETSSFPL